MELVSAYLTCLQKKFPTSKREGAFAPVKAGIELGQIYLDKKVEHYTHTITKEYIQQMINRLKEVGEGIEIYSNGKQIFHTDYQKKNKGEKKWNL